LGPQARKRSASHPAAAEEAGFHVDHLKTFYQHLIFASIVQLGRRDTVLAILMSVKTIHTCIRADRGLK
jgi:hypothetical protein